jgi:hypothetical protein
VAQWPLSTTRGQLGTTRGYFTHISLHHAIAYAFEKYEVTA